MRTIHVITLNQHVCVSAYLLGLLLWIVMSTVSAARPLRYTMPAFLDTPVNVTFERGELAILPCAVHNLGPKLVVWRKLNQANPITIGEFVYDPDPSFMVNHPQQGSSHWDLHISGVQMKHAGVYECQISTKEDFTRNVTLNVIENNRNRLPVYNEHDGKKTQMDKTGIEIDGSDFVDKGTPIILNCTATAIDYRPKGVDWFRDGTKIKSDAHVQITEYQSSDTNVLHSTLEIQSSNMSDMGTYVCRSSKYHVASRKVIVLNTDSTYQKRARTQPFQLPIFTLYESTSSLAVDHCDPGDEGSICHANTKEQLKENPNSAGGERRHPGMFSTSSIVLSYTLLWLPLLRMAVDHLCGH